MTVNRPNMFSGIPIERSDGTISVLCTRPQMADALADDWPPNGLKFLLRLPPWWGNGWDAAAKGMSTGLSLRRRSKPIVFPTAT
ncbi:hypothetical protein DBIPINDM_004875 [Mesorhizobium sp. AR02]|nr:hypothetical protein DBIPINDM_004875 [Mesorhizobium sp. AR02]